MNFILFIIMAILYGALIGVTVGNMKSIELKTKLLYLIVGVVLNLIITTIIVNISKIEINNQEMYKMIKSVDIWLFTAVNSIITIPTFGKYLNNAKMEIWTKEKSKKKMIMLIVIYIIVLFLEVKYLKGLKI